MTRTPLALFAASWLLAGPGLPAQAQNPAPSGAPSKETRVSHARGEFDVKLAPQIPGPGGAESGLGRMSIDKQYHGELDATGVGEMLTAMSPSVKTSGTYVAVERVTGTLNGRHGSFMLWHSGTMTRGAQQLTIVIVPDSGTDELTGISGTLGITIEPGGKHFYDLAYSMGLSE
jgi:Protein of unknown function (DUF3224)